MDNYLYLMQIHISQIAYDQVSWPLPAGHGGVHCLTGGSIRKDPEIGIHKKYLEFLRTLCTAVCTICYYFLIVGKLFVGFVQDHPIHNFYLSSLETDPIGQISTMP